MINRIDSSSCQCCFFVCTIYSCDWMFINVRRVAFKLKFCHKFFIRYVYRARYHYFYDHAMRTINIDQIMFIQWRCMLLTWFCFNRCNIHRKIDCWTFTTKQYFDEYFNFTLISDTVYSNTILQDCKCQHEFCWIDVWLHCAISFYCLSFIDAPINIY